MELELGEKNLTTNQSVAKISQGNTMPYNEDYDDYENDDGTEYIQTDVYIENFIVDGKSYTVSGTLDIRWVENIVEIDYPTMTRKTIEEEITEYELDMDFYDEDGEIVEMTTEMEIAINQHFDEAEVMDILQRNIH
jgi:hypothetical protein